ncbi:MAG: MarC family protein [Rickettsiales bacterium]
MFIESLFIKLFMTLISIANPFAILPVFLSLTASNPGGRFKFATKGILGAAVILTLVVIFGEKALSSLGISVASFEIAGGIVVFLIGMSMLHAKTSTMNNTTPEEHKENKSSDDPSIVPISIPIVAGPASIATIILFTNKIQHHTNEYTSVLAAVYAILFLIWGVFCFGSKISKFLGVSGMNIISRIMGLVLASIGVEMLINGINTAFKLS